MDNKEVQRLMDVADKEIRPMLMALINETFDIFSHTKGVTFEFTRDEYNIFINGVLSRLPLNIAFTDEQTGKVFAVHVIQLLLVNVSPRDNNTPLGTFNYDIEAGWRTEILGEINTNNKFMNWYVSARNEFNSRITEQECTLPTFTGGTETVSVDTDDYIYGDDYCDATNIFACADIVIEFIINAVLMSSPYNKHIFKNHKYLYFEEATLIWMYMKINSSIKLLTVATTRSGLNSEGRLVQRKIIINSTANFFVHKVTDNDEKEMLLQIYENDDNILCNHCIGLDLSKRADIMTAELGVININTI